MKSGHTIFGYVVLDTVTGKHTTDRVGFCYGYWITYPCVYLQFGHACWAEECVGRHIGYAYVRYPQPKERLHVRCTCRTTFSLIMLILETLCDVLYECMLNSTVKLRIKQFVSYLIL